MSDLEARAFRKRRIAGITALVPCDSHADEWLDMIGEGKEVLLTGRRPRNPRHHRLLFAVLKKVHENTNRWETLDALLDELKMLTGLYDMRSSAITGEVFYVPRSISFASMSQDQFAPWFDQAVRLLAEQALGTTYEELAEEVRHMTGEVW